MTGRKSETRVGGGGLGTREEGAGERKREGRLHFRSISFAVVALSLFSFFFLLLFSLLLFSLLLFSFLRHDTTFQNDFPTTLPTNFTRADPSPSLFA